MPCTHLQPGIVIDVTLGATYAAKDLIKVGDLAGVTLKAGVSGDIVAVQIAEVFNVPKLSSDDMAQGVKVYLDAASKRVTLSTNSGANILAGRTAYAAGNGATTVALKLNA